MISEQEGYNKLKSNRQTNKTQHNPEQTNGKRPAITENLEMSKTAGENLNSLSHYI